MKSVKIEGYNNFELVGYLWDKVDSPIGVVQIIHGMQEHAGRYNSLARYLNKKGLIVFASDLRGHGQTAIINSLPYGYSSGDIFMEIVKDQMVITEYLSDKFNLPVSIFAHSFGSFIAQRYMIENGFKVKNVILSGSTHTNSFQYKAGYILSQIQKFFGLKNKPAKMIEGMSIKGYGKKYPHGNWLTRDNKIWEEYQQDKLCGQVFPISFYNSFFKHARNNYKNLNNIPYYLPILILSGTNDPVPGKNGLFKLFCEYGKAGKKLYLKTYLDARHEIVNELNKEEVYEDIAEFVLNDKIASVMVGVENL